MKYLNLIIFFSLLLSFGCSNYKFASNPTLKKVIPEQWDSENGNTGEDRINHFWLQEFNDPWLNQTVRSAWRDNPNIAMMAERVIAFGEDAVIAGATLFPNVQTEIIAARSKRNLVGFIPDNDTSFTSNSFNSGVNITWEIDLWGKIRDQKKAISKKFLGFTAEFEAARLSLAGQVAKNWFELVENGLQIKLVEETVRTYQKNRDFVSNRFEKGLATAFDDQLSELSHSSALATLHQRQRVMKNKVRSFHLLLGQYAAGELDRNLSSAELPKVESMVLPSTPAKVLENRPDLQAARLQLEASGIELVVARKGFLPSIAILGGPGSRSGKFEDLLDQRFRTWDLAGSLSQPIFQGGRLRAQTRKAKALQNAAFAEYRKTALEAFGEVESLLSSEKYLLQEEIQLQRATKAAFAAAAISWERYQNGVEGIFDALETQRRSFEAESRLLSIKKERILNRINLHLALGQPALPTYDSKK